LLAQPATCRISPKRLYAGAYSLYSQLPAIFGDHAGEKYLQ